jgi:predicted nucleotidyltransferase
VPLLLDLLYGHGYRNPSKEPRMRTENMTIPEAFQQDIDRAVRILKEEGCAEIFLFGSGAEGKVSERSDIDLAVRGCPPGHFFRALGRLLWELHHPVDLINLDMRDSFAQYLQKKGVLRQVG